MTDENATENKIQNTKYAHNELAHPTHPQHNKHTNCLPRVFFFFPLSPQVYPLHTTTMSFLHLVSSVSKTKAIGASFAASAGTTVVLYNMLQSTGERRELLSSSVFDGLIDGYIWSETKNF